jgi:hypothetical protein
MTPCPEYAPFILKDPDTLPICFGGNKIDIVLKINSETNKVNSGDENQLHYLLP